MFKIGKLRSVENEEVSISYITQESYSQGKGKEQFETLSFTIEGNIDDNKYSFCFELNCRPEDLLKIEESKKMDMSKYVFGGETFFNYNDQNGIDPEMNIKIMRYMKSRFVISIHFGLQDDFVGIIEFDFNLEDYLL